MFNARRVTILTLITIVLFGVFVSACDVSSPKPQASDDPKEQWPVALTMTTGSVGGTSFIVGGAISRIVNDKLGLQCSVETTGGPSQMVKLVDSKQADLGWVTNITVMEGWLGSGWAKDDASTYRQIRALVPFYWSAGHFYSLDSTGIRSLQDLEGKVVGVGPVGGTPGTYLPIALQALGIKPARFVNASFEDLTQQMQDGRLDAIGRMGGLPLPAIGELQATSKVNVFGFTQEQVKEVQKEIPAFSPLSVEDGTYQDVEGLIALGDMTYLIANKDMPNDLAYELTKLMFESQQELVKSHASCAEMDTASITEIAIPIHEGALQYYTELGLTAPTPKLSDE